ncbi:MAG: hypothetical protein JO235_14840 [Chroococcidiopsidaceae cyanobacterium CP_BM_RX_35]|nr:hypothetical protein [Chroococcidiopsidaceae cyanobacterium CP_BM_RX_35]
MRTSSDYLTYVHCGTKQPWGVKKMGLPARYRLFFRALKTPEGGAIFISLDDSLQIPAKHKGFLLWRQS